jgi:hypothetical protein
VISDIQKLCVRWVPLSLTVEHKTNRKVISSELLVCFEADREAFLVWIFTTDRTWVHRFEVETERQSGIAPSLIFLV